VTDLRTEGERRVDDLQVELLRRAGTARRAEMALRLSWDCVELSRSALSRRHPDWEDSERDAVWVGLAYGREAERLVRSGTPG
jgi:hypothetical protein